MAMNKKTPIRTCTGCRKAVDKKELIRVVRNKEGEVFVDKTGKQNGRGAYICASVECLNKAIKGKALERTLKITKLEEEVISQLEKQIGEINE